MKACVCDMCGCVVNDPHKGYFREYYIGADINEVGLWLPVKSLRKVRIDLCEHCWRSLIDIARKKENK